MSPTRRELVRATRARIVEAAGRLTRERGAERFQHGRAGQGSGRRPRHGLRALPFEASRPRRARVVDLPHVVLDEPRTATADPLAGVPRHARRRLPALVRARRAHARAAHAHRAHRRRPRPATTASTRSSSARWSKRSRRAGQLRAHWSIDEAVDALGALTSYSTYERLRRAPRTPEEVEAVLAKLVVSIVSRGGAVPANTAR